MPDHSPGEMPLTAPPTAAGRASNDIPASTNGTTDLDGVKTAARRVLEEIFPADDEAALTAAVTNDFVNHEAPPGTPPGPRGAIFYMHALARAFSDQRWTVHEVIAEGDTAVVYCTHSGRHTGPFFDLPPTGREFAYRQMHMIRVVGGKGAEHWAVRDDAALLRQLTGPGT